MRKILLNFTVSAVVLSGIFQTAIPTYAERVTQSQINEKQEQIDGIETKIQQLDDHIMMAMEKSQKLNEQIQMQQGKSEEARVEFEKAKEDLETHKKIYSERLKSIQSEGKTTIATYSEFLLSSEDLSQFLTRFTAISTIIENDVDLLNGLNKKQQVLEVAEGKLQTELANLNNSKKQLDSEQKKIEEDKVKIEGFLANAQTELQGLQEQMASQDEAERQAQIAREEASRQAQLAQERAQQQAAPQAPANTASATKKVENTSASTPAVAAPLPDSDAANRLIAYAKQFLGVPYLWGGTTPAGFDCSGFTSYVFRNALGITLPRVSRDQQNIGTRVPLTQVQPGDLLFRGNPAYHVSIYIGGGQYIHSPQTGDVVRIRTYDPSKFTNAVRVLP